MCLDTYIHQPEVKDRIADKLTWAVISQQSATTRFTMSTLGEVKAADKAASSLRRPRVYTGVCCNSNRKSVWAMSRYFWKPGGTPRDDAVCGIPFCRRIDRALALRSIIDSCN